MKKVIVLVLLIISLFACESTPSKTNEKKEEKSEQKLTEKSGTVILKEEAVVMEIKSAASKVKSSACEVSLDNNKLSVCAGNGRYWFFRGDKCWKKTYGRNHKIGKACAISEMFPGLPNNIDAACYINGAYWFFKGQNCWKKKFGKDVYSKGSISKAWKIPSRYLTHGIDAVCAMNDRYWFFIGNKCWRKTYGKDIKGPYLIKDKWENFPSKLSTGVEAVCAISDRYWFFKGEDCWKKAFGKDTYDETKINTWIPNKKVEWTLKQDKIIYLDTKDILIDQHDIDTEDVIDVNTAIAFEKTFTFKQSFENKSTLSFTESLEVTTSFDFSTKFPLFSSDCSVSITGKFGSGQEFVETESKEYCIQQKISFKGPRPAFKVVGYVDFVKGLEKDFVLYIWVTAEGTTGFGANRILKGKDLIAEINDHFNGEIVDKTNPARMKIKLHGVLKANLGIRTGIKTIEI